MEIDRNLLPMYRNALESVGEVKGQAFAYAVYRNLQSVKAEIKKTQNKMSLQHDPKVSKADKAVVAKYDKDRIPICQKHAETGEDGKYKFSETGGYIMKDKKAFDKELKVLKKKHEKAQAAIKKHQKSVTDYMDKKVEIKWYMFKDDLPEDITANQLELVDFMLEALQETPLKVKK